MFQPSVLRERYSSREPILVLVLAGVLTFVHGFAIALRLFFRSKNEAVGLSEIEWVVYTVGPILVCPFLLFGVLYVVGTRLERLPTVFELLPGLLVAVVVGTFLGQYMGDRLFVAGWTPLGQATIDHLFMLDPWVLPFWRELLEPPLHSLMTAVAAVALARTSLE